MYRFEKIILRIWFFTGFKVQSKYFLLPNLKEQQNQEYRHLPFLYISSSSKVIKIVDSFRIFSKTGFDSFQKCFNSMERSKYLKEKTFHNRAKKSSS